ncbi:hypothetical protein LPJ53_005279 [Coemansia erecta]|uniref:RING-type domain-containing protein n=1 Tax=Coemansia erecta TaxID=147472 RepID=A0A9W7XSS1_9FUNG|nr:hypothetical protein LPJ53_005279 [Coemansia erecta]
MDFDSDSDGMSSEIRLLRRSLGLSASAKKRPAPAERFSQTTQRLEQPAQRLDKPEQPAHSTRPEQPAQRPVTPGEIAALLSPRKPPSKKPRPASKPSTPQRTPQRTSHRTPLSPTYSTPQRTPESRMASLWDNLDASPWRSPLAGSPQPATTATTAVVVATRQPRRASLASSPLHAQRASGPLGRVEDALVTPADLERAERKLGASVARTQQQILEDLRRRLVGFARQQQQQAGEVGVEEGEEAALLCQFHTMGHGRMALGAAGVLWQGTLLGPLAHADADPAAGHAALPAAPTQPAALLFPWQRVTAARRKHVDGRELLLMTVDEDLGLGFFCPASSAAAIDVLAARALALQSAARTAAAEGLRAAGDLEARSLARRLLALGSGAAPEDVERLATEDFLESALPLVRRLAAQLAELAQPDDVTETLPGTCTLCYAAPEAHELQPCGHRLCAGCLARLHTPGHALLCPWDRTPTTGCAPTCM